MSCNTGNDDHVAAYIAGVLSGDELEAFEIHLLSCAECRDAVRRAASLRRSLLTYRAAPSRRRSILWFGGALVAASLALVALPRKSGSLRRLGMVSPPVFQGASVRGTEDSTRTLVDRGMSAYSGGDFAAAARHLAAAHDSSAPVSFYLGVALLMRDEPTQALAAFARAKQPNGNPFAADAHFLAAKSWLRLANADSALAEIERAFVVDGAARQRLEALRDSVRRVR